MSKTSIKEKSLLLGSFCVFLLIIGAGLYFSNWYEGTCRQIYEATPISQVPAGCINERGGLR